MVNVLLVKEYSNGCCDFYISFSKDNKSDFYCIKKVVGSEDGDWNVKIYKALYDFSYGWRYSISHIAEFHNSTESEQRDFMEFLLGHFEEMMFC